jgi:hypothetical protein
LTALGMVINSLTDGKVKKKKNDKMIFWHSLG